MSSNNNYTDIEKAFYSDGYQIGMKAIDSDLSKESMYYAISEMYSTIEELIVSLTDLAHEQNQPIQCKKGCEYCCHQPVYILNYEMQFLNTFIKENFSKKEQAGIRNRANKNRLELSKLPESEILNSKQPCPLFNDGTCSAYEARPMACRIYLSSNVNTCLKFFTNPEDKSSFPALLEFPMQAGRMMNEGFKSALKTKDVVVEEFRIDEKILLWNELPEDK